MPERATITQGVQLGVEATPGTGVAANKYLNSIDVDPEIHFDMATFQPTGQKFSSIVAPGKEWSEAGIKGVVSYAELPYLLNGVMVAAAGVQQGATTAYAWTFVPNSRGSDTIKTFTIEQGDANRAQKFVYGVISDLSFTFNRMGATVEGKMFAQAIQDAITLTATPAAIEEKPVLPNQVDVYIDPTSAALGTTKMTRVLEAKINIQNRFGMLWVMNSAVGSFAAHVELDPNVTVELQVEADAAGMALLNTMRAGTTQYVRVKATSPDLAGTAFPYSATFDVAAKLSGVSPYSDQDGVYALTWTNTAVHDPAWGSGKAMQFVVVDKLVTL